MLVEHLVLGGGVAGGIVGPDTELAVAGDVEGLALGVPSSSLPRQVRRTSTGGAFWMVGTAYRTWRLPVPSYVSESAVCWWRRPGERGPLELRVVQGADELGVQPFDPSGPRVGLHLQSQGVGEGRVDDGGTGKERVVDRHQGDSDVGAVGVGVKRPRFDAASF